MDISHQLTEALFLLKQYSGLTPKIPHSEAEKKDLRAALKLVVNLADAENFGICAVNSQEAFIVLHSYLTALGYDFHLPVDLNCHDYPVYLKFSTERMSYHISSYDGEYRGVLITIFAQNQDEIVGTYGYLPLQLFD